MSLWQDFQTNSGKGIYKWVHYFPIYERHFECWRNKSGLFLEIGVGRGGSLQMWQRYFGPLMKVVGIDIEPSTKVHEVNGVFVRIGDQADHEFLNAVIDEFGVPDIVLDDGSHRMRDVLNTFEHLYPKMQKNAIYMVEDMHTSYWEEYGGGLHKPDSFINFAKACVDRLNADHTRGALPSDSMTRETLSLSFYDSIVCFEKGNVWRKTAPIVGETD